MKTIYALVAFLTLGFAVQAQTGAKIEFETEVIDYGQIEKGSDGIRTFVFTNTGDEPLIINRVYSSCGCTIPEKPEAPIAPGEKGEIKVKYDTKRVGPIRKTITVYSNDANAATKAIKIKGEILKPENDGKSVLEKTLPKS